MRYLIVDVETTGGSPKSSKITEIAMYLFDGEKIIKQLVSLINPEMPIPPFISNLTGINDQMVKDAPKFHELAKQIIELSKNAVFVAHNVSFDYGMIRSEFKSLGFDFRSPHLCTVSAARKIIPGKESYSLGKLSRELKIQITQRHRAAGDAKATVELFKLLLAKNSKEIETHIQHEVNPKYIHPNLDLFTIDELPTKTGVYRFYNEFNQLIYIGKSINIKKRIEQHLKNRSTEKAIRLSKEISKIEYDLCGSELIALLHESYLIKKHQTKYNRALKKNQFPYGIFDEISEDGYLYFVIKALKKDSPTPLIYFSTKKEANAYLDKIREEYTFCQKYCGTLPKHKNECFYFGIKECLGACAGKENAKKYNKRVQKYIDNLTYKENRFYIINKGRERKEKSLVLIENGVFKGYGYAPYHFDYLNTDQWNRFIDFHKEDRDSKIIVMNYLRNKKSGKIIKF